MKKPLNTKSSWTLTKFFWEILMDVSLCPRIFSLGLIKDERGSVKQTFVNTANFVMQILRSPWRNLPQWTKGRISYRLWKGQLSIRFSKNWKGFGPILSCRASNTNKYKQMQTNTNKYKQIQTVFNSLFQELEMFSAQS